MKNKEFFSRSLFKSRWVYTVIILPMGHTPWRPYFLLTLQAFVVMIVVIWRNIYSGIWRFFTFKKSTSTMVMMAGKSIPLLKEHLEDVQFCLGSIRCDDIVGTTKR